MIDKAQSKNLGWELGSFKWRLRFIGKNVIFTQP